MAKFIRIVSGQGVSDIILLAEAHSIRETFPNLRRVLGPFSEELKDVTSNEVNLGGDTRQVVFLFVVDYKVYYPLLGMKSAQSVYPTPWCKAPLAKMDKDKYCLTQEDLPPLPAVLDFLHVASDTNLQKSGTFNLMHLYTRAPFKRCYASTLASLYQVWANQQSRRCFRPSRATFQCTSWARGY